MGNFHDFKAILVYFIMELFLRGGNFHNQYTIAKNANITLCENFRFYSTLYTASVLIHFNHYLLALIKESVVNNLWNIMISAWV